MTGDDDGARREYDEPRVPRPLRDRVDELFVAERGYEPASFQEALSVIVNMAERAREGDAEPATPAQSDSTEGASTAGTETDAEEWSPAAAGSPVAGVGEDDATDDTTDDAGMPDLEDISVEHEATDSVSFDEYVDGLEAVGDQPSPAVESLLDTEHADGVVRELASEVLEEMTQDAFQELEHGVDQGVGAGVTDGRGGTETADGGATAPSGSDGDGVPDSLTADPESNCAICGRAHRVSVLQTTILDEDGSVALVCPSCSE